MSKLTSTVFNNLISEGLPWAAELGVYAEHMGAGEARLRLPYQDSSLRPGGTISGPHMMLLADACMYAVVMSLILYLITLMHLSKESKSIYSHLQQSIKVPQIANRIKIKLLISKN